MPTIIISVFLILLLPLGFSKSLTFPTKVKHTVFASFLISLLILILYFSNLYNDSVSKWPWLNLGSASISLAFQLDQYALIFLPIAFFVSWCILNFSTWYMETDPKTNQFFKYLLIFLTAMICLVTANNLYTLFIGWEGVGIMSFLLIGWYHSRANAATSAFQAVLYNRVGDIGFLFVFCWMIIHYTSVDLPFILSTKTSLAPLVGLILAAASKSAQFSLHPWLIAAMEGPTPVSALLHSSTMVIAGIFLLIRIHPLIEQSQTALTLCLVLGAASTAHAAISALLQYDIKKIIAYSTSSQLGLMMVAIGINQPDLAFLHISTHAFFKAMLFLCSGLIIHNLNDEQDIRKMGGLIHSLPITVSCLTIGSFALMAAPFLAGFYSKDPIIETLSSSHINMIALMLTLVATIFTAAYSIRLMYYTIMLRPRSFTLARANENIPTALGPIVYLAVGSICSGIIIPLLLPMKQAATLTMHPHIKMAVLLITPLAFLLAYDLMQIARYKSYTYKYMWLIISPLVYTFVVHRTATYGPLYLAWGVITHVIERIIIKKLAPELLIATPMTPAQVMKSAQKGRIKLYLSTLFISLAFALVFAVFILPPP